MKELTYLETPDDLLNWADREVAVIITSEGKIYESDINHQYCFEEIRKDFFKQYSIDFSDPVNEKYDKELEAAINITNNLFQKNKYYGFDIYRTLEQDYFIAHYPQNLRECYEIAKLYAEAHDMELGTFTNETKLTNDFSLVV